MDLQEKIAIKIQSIYIFDNKTKRQLLWLVKDARKENLEILDKWLDIILRRLADFTDKLLNKN